MQPPVTTDRLAVLNNEARRLLMPLEADTSAPQLVYHYTSLDALMAIIQKRTLWCSNIKYSNDPSEVTHGDRLIDEILRARLSQPTYQPIRRFFDILDYYAASFSAQPDLLPQWRAYCRNGRGVALGISSAVLRDIPHLMFGRVEYDEERQKQCVNSLLDIFAPAIAGYEGSDDTNAHTFRAELVKYLGSLKGMFKAPSYRSEEEYRLFDFALTNSQDDAAQLQFRTTATLLVPYIVADISASVNAAAASPFAEIVVGPCLEKETESAIELFLLREHLSGITIRRSNVQMRAI